ncbi:hypothetical protein ZWY2020_051210 [Hordeum vulgare]|nr:hypothetical protein ZWY2020_051210 [Hordeum vulgare]
MRRPSTVLPAIAWTVLLLALAGLAVYRQGHGDGQAAALGDQVASAGRVVEVAASRGVVQGVSEKSTAPALLGGGAYDWTNAMLAWQRTAFHFQPQKNWMNDPNGPLYYKGWYHLFYQWNPDGRCGEHHVGHAVSRDLVHWLHLPPAMVPDHWYDINGVWSGSATQLPDGRIVMLYTGSTEDAVQVQLLAEPADLSDLLLRRWAKSESNPVLVPPPGIGLTDFRDPTTAWLNPTDKAWRITIGSKNQEHAGLALVYRTEDFLHYDLLPALLHVAGHRDVGVRGLLPGVRRPRRRRGARHLHRAGAGGEARAQGQPRRRPARLLRHRHLRPRHRPVDARRRGDRRRDRAPVRLRQVLRVQVVLRPRGRRRVLWGWIGESDSERADVLKGWASLQSIPRTVLLDTKTGSNLLQWPVVEVENLRMRGKRFDGLDMPPGSVVPLDVGRATQLDVEAVFQVQAGAPAAGSAAAGAEAPYNCSASAGSAGRGLLGPFGLLVLADDGLSEQTAVYFYLVRGADGKLSTHFCQDAFRSSKANDLVKAVYGSSVPLLDGEDLSVRILVDHSIVESFAQVEDMHYVARVPYEGNLRLC